MQLSNVSSQDLSTYTDVSPSQTQSNSSASYASSSLTTQPFSDTSSGYLPHYSTNFYRNTRFPNNRNTSFSPRNSYAPPIPSSQPPPRSHFDPQTSQQKNMTSTQPFNTRPKVSPPTMNRLATPSPSQSAVNVIDVSHSLTAVAPEQQEFSATVCSQCYQVGHDVSTCPSF